MPSNHKQIWIFGLFVFLFLGSLHFLGCNKTDQPLGVFAPRGLDVPSQTPTPQNGAINVYVSDSGTAVQAVSIYLLDPAGNTSSVQQTQPVVGYAPFNPPILFNGIWHVVVPAQSVSYVSAGPVTIKHTYGYSAIPITVTGAGQYAATFITGGNSVAIGPVSQTMTTNLPDFIPVTISYSENGNLDVPVSVTLEGYPSLLGFSLTSSPNLILGGGVNFSAVSIVKNTCYYQTIPLSVAAIDFSGNAVSQTGASVFKGWSIPVTLFMDKNSIGSGKEYCSIEVGSSLDCGATIYSIQYQIGGSDPPGGTVSGPYLIAGGQSIPVTYTAVTDPYIRAVLNYPGGQIVGDIQMQYLSFGSYSDMGNASF